MEPIATIAKAITTLILNEAFKESGKNLGKGVTDKIAQLVTTVREKYKASNTEGVLKQVKEYPTEANVAMLEAVLIAQMSGDKIFVEKLVEIIKQLESAKVLYSSNGNWQIGAILKDVQVSGGDSSTFNIGNTTQNT